MPKSSFNAFGSKGTDYGAHNPVWLGVPTPVPVGGTLASAYAIAGALYGAGFPVNLASKVITPFIGWKVVSFTAAVSPATEDVIVVEPAKLGKVIIAPAADDVIQVLGSTFAATGKAAVVASSTLLTSGENKGCYEVKVLHSATIDTPNEGDIITLSAATAAGSSKSIKVQPNGYLWNDIYFGDLENDLAATGAVIEHAPDGILIDLTAAADVKAQMKAAVPGVYQVSNA